ncbi:hypothetical protein PDIG_74690 [Penicillium digitatum PHI26]|uniref:Uncharacterized protein n=1 Tax=Penicillium digitatum (strain PHI26 / CECT 20796) TaxID=1170229 RepID=K9FCU1_PEND2|nr:hypothetical protein PDIG_74690 [Penicillium digitatum PHI26]
MHLKAVILVAGCLAAEGLVVAAPGKDPGIFLKIDSLGLNSNAISVKRSEADTEAALGNYKVFSSYEDAKEKRSEADTEAALGNYKVFSNYEQKEKRV